MFTLTGRSVPRPCTQPVPWCYVSRRSRCPDALRAHNPEGLWYSLRACANESVFRPNHRFY